MKKVLFTATVDSHIKQFHLPYLKLFKDNGYEVHVATNGDEQIEYCDVKHKISFERSPFRINNIKAIKQLKKIINEEQFEIIHCHTPMGSVITRIATRKARKKGTKVIYTAHGFHFYKGAPLINWLIYYPIEKIMARYTDCLITINEEDYEFAKKHLKAKQIELVHGVGVDESKFNIQMTEEEKADLRKSLGIEKDDFVITYVAELNKNKNQIMIIKAMREVIKYKENTKLLLIGEGSSREFLEKEISKNNLKNNVFLLGYRKDVPQLLKITDLYVSTSKREGLGLNVIEAMIEKIPIVGTYNRGHKELVIENKTGFLIRSFKDFNLLKEKILYLINNKEELKIFSQNEEIKKYFLANTVKEMERIYMNIK